MYRTIEITQYDTQDVLGKCDYTEDCWEWQGCFYGNGYGKYGNKGYVAHRLVYHLLIDDVDNDKSLDHLCKNRACVRPDHLEVVDPVENVMRGESPHAKNARKTHCKRGHKFNSKNTYHPPSKRTRECRICRDDATRRYIERKRG